MNKIFYITFSKIEKNIKKELAPILESKFFLKKEPVPNLHFSNYFILKKVILKYFIKLNVQMKGYYKFLYYRVGESQTTF